MSSDAAEPPAEGGDVESAVCSLHEALNHRAERQADFTGLAKQALAEVLEERFRTEQKWWSESFELFKSAVETVIPDYVASAVAANMNDLHVKMQTDLSQTKLAQEESFEAKFGSMNLDLEEVRHNQADLSNKVESISGHLQSIRQHSEDHMASATVEKVDFLSRDLQQWRREIDDQMVSFGDCVDKAERAARSEVDSLRSMLEKVCSICEEVGMRFDQIQNDVSDLGHHIQRSIGETIPASTDTSGNGALQEKLTNLRNEAVTLFGHLEDAERNMGTMPAQGQLQENMQPVKKQAGERVVGDGVGKQRSTIENDIVHFEKSVRSRLDQRIEDRCNKVAQNGATREDPNDLLLELKIKPYVLDISLQLRSQFSDEVNQVTQRVQGLADNIGSVTTCMVDLREDALTRLGKAESDLADVSKHQVDVLDLVRALETKVQANSQGAMKFLQNAGESTTNQDHVSMTALHSRLAGAERQVERLADQLVKIGVVPKDCVDLGVTHDVTHETTPTSSVPFPLSQMSMRARSPRRAHYVGQRYLSPRRDSSPQRAVAESVSPRHSHVRTTEALSCAGRLVDGWRGSMRVAAPAPQPGSVTAPGDDANFTPTLVPALRAECQMNIQSAVANVLKMQLMNNQQSPEQAFSTTSPPIIVSSPLNKASQQQSSSRSNTPGRTVTELAANCLVTAHGISPLPASWAGGQWPPGKSIGQLPGQPPPTISSLKTGEISRCTTGGSISRTNSRGSTASKATTTRRPTSAGRSGRQ